MTSRMEARKWPSPRPRRHVQSTLTGLPEPGYPEYSIIDHLAAGAAGRAMGGVEWNSRP